MHAWEKWHDWNATTMAPVTAWFVEALRARPGMSLLDVACGTGIPSLTLARRVGDTGAVLATDSSEEMLEAARRIADAAQLKNIAHQAMDMSALALEAERFDGASVAFGLMFAKEPAAAVRELVRVVKPGAPVAVSVWAEAGVNPWLATLFGSLRRFVPAPPAPAGGGPFRLAEPGVLEELFVASGLREVKVVARPIRAEFDSVEHHWEAMSEMAAPVRAVAATLPAGELEALRSAIAEAIAPYVTDGRPSIPGQALCAVGIR